MFRGGGENKKCLKPTPSNSVAGVQDLFYSHPTNPSNCVAFPKSSCQSMLLETLCCLFFGFPSMGLTLHENPNTKSTKLSNSYLCIYKSVHLLESQRFKNVSCSVRKSTSLNFFHPKKNPLLIVSSIVLPQMVFPCASSWLWTNWERKESASLKKFKKLGGGFSKLVSKLPETNSSHLNIWFPKRKAVSQIAHNQHTHMLTNDTNGCLTNGF